MSNIDSIKNGYDVFLAEPAHRQAVTYLLDSMRDETNGRSLRYNADLMLDEPFFQAVPEAQRGLVRALAVIRAIDAEDDIFVMEAMTR